MKLQKSKGIAAVMDGGCSFFGIIGIIMVAVLPDREASVSVINEVRIKADDRQKPYIHAPKQNDELPEI